MNLCFFNQLEHYALDATNPLLFYRVNTDLTHLYKTEPDFYVQSLLLQCLVLLSLHSNIHLGNFYKNNLFHTTKLKFDMIPNTDSYFNAKDTFIFSTNTFITRELQLLATTQLDLTGRSVNLLGWCRSLQLYFDVCNEEGLVIEFVEKLNGLDTLVNPSTHQTCFIQKPHNVRM